MMATTTTRKEKALEILQHAQERFDDVDKSRDIMRIQPENATQVFQELYAALRECVQAYMVMKDKQTEDDEEIIQFAAHHEDFLGQAAEYMHRYRIFLDINEKRSAPVSPHIAKESFKYMRKYIPMLTKKIEAL